MLLTIGLVRLLLFIFNGILAALGLSVLVISSLILRDVTVYGKLGGFMASAFGGPLISMIVVSAVVLVVVILGVYATWKERENFLMACIVVLFITFIAEVVDSTVAFLRSNDVTYGVREAMLESLAWYSIDPAVYKNFNTMQRNLRCCGVVDQYDYTAVFNNMSLPASCCRVYTGQMCTNSLNSHEVFQIGCFDAVDDFVRHAGVTLGSITISLAFLEITGVVLYIFLLIALQNEKKRMGIGRYRDVPVELRMKSTGEQRFSQLSN